jgi:hypothetical protein
MLNYIKSIVVSKASCLLKIFEGLVILPLKIKALKMYVRLVGIARDLSIYYLTCIAMLLLGMVAFIMIHVGILLVLDCDLSTKGWIILILGIIYGLISYTVISNICSEKYWLEMTSVSKMINEVVKNEGDKKD